MSSINETATIADITQRKAALLAGFGYLPVFIIGIFANFIALENLIVSGDAAATTNNIVASETLFRMGIAGFVIVAIFDLMVAWALYVFFKPINKSLALLAAWFRLMYVAIAGVALLNLIVVTELLSGADYLIDFAPTQLNIQVMLHLNAYEWGWRIGIVFFGIHVLVLGYLILRSSYIPRILGIMLIVATVGYLVSTFSSFLMSNFADHETIFLVILAVPAVIAELSLTFWLLFKGGKDQQLNN